MLDEAKYPRHVKDLEFSLARFEKVENTEKTRDPMEDSDIDGELKICHPVNANMIAKSLEINEIFLKRSLAKGDPARDIDKVLIFGYPGTGIS